MVPKGTKRYFRYLKYFFRYLEYFRYLKFIWYLVDDESTCVSEGMSV